VRYGTSVGIVRVSSKKFNGLARIRPRVDSKRAALVEPGGSGLDR
jgi:hypothetical protein